MNLKNKTILITGGARRVGEEISRKLVSAGANVIIHYNQSVREARELQRQLSNGGNRCPIYQADLTQVANLERMVEAIQHDHQRIDGVVCNASVFKHTPFFSVREEEWDHILAVNLKSPFFLCQMIGKQMIKQKSGKIVLVTDVSADHPWPGYLPYTISKAGLQHLVYGLARVLAPHVQVNGVAPGTVLPAEEASEADMLSYRNQTLLQRIGTPADIAETVLFLLEKSDFITGTVIPVDGGYRLKRY